MSFVSLGPSSGLPTARPPSRCPFLVDHLRRALLFALEPQLIQRGHLLFR
jgi:hypothetical protein